tara:strand:+ start:661 stop:1086 length:426 start_codon:yes stop_codon:yes gene_type:complete
MAYFIFNNNSLFRIAANDAHKNSLNINESDYVIKDVSDQDFNKVRLNKKTAKLVNDDIVLQDILVSSINEEELNQNIQLVSDEINRFSINNENNALYDDIKNYQNTLHNFDSSSVTYPFSKTWEEYCVDNSITFFHPLQIP